MNVFILCTGRCGSITFIKACSHISNFTSLHESRTNLVGEERLDYPDNHIEADNRLSWLLGRLDCIYGDKAVYIHLTRNIDDTAVSMTKRYHTGLIKAYRKPGILNRLPEKTDPFLVSKDCCNTINSNIELFLKDKTKKMNIRIEHAKDQFKEFWSFIEAEGDLDSAVHEFDIPYNKSP